MSAAKPMPIEPLRSFAAMFGRDEVFEEVDLASPPLSEKPAAGRAVVAADLARFAKLWLLIARGGAGKTMLARWLGGCLIERTDLAKTVMLDLDPTNRSLSRSFENVQQPRTRQSSDVEAFFRSAIDFIGRDVANGVVDFGGGGDAALMKLVELNAGFDRDLEAKGVGLVASYVLTPSVDDLSVLRSFEDAGFQPKATALILNMGRAERLADFGAVRAQAVYKTAVARGAVEIVMPALEPLSLAREIERKRLHFHDARDGIVPTGLKVAPIDGLNAALVRQWLAKMDEAFAPIQGWLPWN